MKPNKKKCEICGYEFDDDADIEELLTKGPSKCPFCIKVLELINIIEQYNLLHFENVTNNEIYKKNLYPDNSRRNIFLGNNSSSTLDEFEKYYNFKKRSKIIVDLIERKLLYNVIVNSKFQKKSYYRNLKKLDRNDIQTFILANEKKLKEDFYLEHIFLYGSFAKNSERLDSDIDFLVIFKEDISYKEKKAKKEAVIEFLTKAFQRFVDIQEIFTVLSKEIVLEASHTKKLL